MVAMRIGDRLVSKGLITKEQLDEALSVQKNLPIRKKILVVLKELGYIDENDLLKFFVEQCRLGNLNLDSIIMDFPASEDEILKKLAVILNTDYYDLDSIDIDFKLASKVSLEVLRKYFAIPIKQNEFNVVVAFGDPLNLQAIEIVQMAFKQLPVKVAVTRMDQVRKYIAKLELNEKVKGTIENIRKEMHQELIDAKGSSSVLKLIEMIFKNAILARASDIHIEPSQHNCIVRDRIDGILNESFVFDADIYPPLSSRLKLLANIDIAEKRKPQDGRISLKMFDKEYDFRVSSLPVMNGESIVLRILDKSKVMIKMEELGMNNVTFNRFVKATKTPYGMIFVTGPTGSGKTTTLYAALNAIKSTEKKIITVEDPVEYQMNMIQQIQVNEKVDLTFANALRSILRQDPDIIMVGEVRDATTLQIAIQAALTGHLVFSTLHTNDAISSITRLLDMGIEPYFISSALVAVLAQRLVRKLCPSCKQQIEVQPEILESIKEYLPKEYKFYKHVGCNKCSNTGFIGREMVSEILPITEDISRLIASNAPQIDIKRQAAKDGFVSMFHDGILKASKGITTLDEVYRVAKL